MIEIFMNVARAWANPGKPVACLEQEIFEKGQVWQLALRYLIGDDNLNESADNPLDYYARHGMMTDPGEFAGLFEKLPGDIPGRPV